LGPLLDLISTTGLLKAIEKQLQLRSDSQGWTASQFIITLLLLNAIGGDRVSDVEQLESDRGLCCLMTHLEHHEFCRATKTLEKKRWRKIKTRTFPSPTALFDFVKLFHNEDACQPRPHGHAVIPESNELLKKLNGLLPVVLACAAKLSTATTATLDQDATLAPTSKREAFYCYKGYKAYQPMNTYWFETGMLVHSEFRDGNVPASFDVLRVL
jgi:hypothetical protein